MKQFKLAIILILLPLVCFGRDLYKTTLIQAAPGQLLELIDVLKKKANDQKKDLYLLRHSQGDHWDLMLLEMVDDYEDATMVSTLGTNGVVDDPLDHLISWREEFYVQGPGHRDFRKEFNRAGFFHIEIFVALAGKRKDLLQERAMENKYLEELSRDTNQIFIKTLGAKWDMFTIGYYRDLKEYAESSDNSDKDQEAAAVKAGFTSAGSIGAYLRRFISEHHDTLAGKIK